MEPRPISTPGCVRRMLPCITKARCSIPWDLKILDPISVKWTGKPIPFREPEGRVALIIKIDKALPVKLPLPHTVPGP